MSASAWISDLQETIRRYSESRRRTPIVQVTLTRGESYYVMNASGGESDALLAFSVYPEDMRGLDDLLGVETVDDQGHRQLEHVTPKMLVVPPHAVAKVEIVDEIPGRADAGFRVPLDPE